MAEETTPRTTEQKLETANKMFDYWMNQLRITGKRACATSAKFWAVVINDYERELGKPLTVFFFPR